MSKIMTVDILSSIKGAKPSEAVNKLFETIKKAHVAKQSTLNATHRKPLSLEDLRADLVVESTAMERQIIVDNFPKVKHELLVVSKIIDA